MGKKHYTVLVCAMLVLVTIVAYEPVRRCEFTSFDDNEYVTENSHVVGGVTWESVVWAFTQPYAANWHPLTWVSHMTDCELFGLDPFWHHMTNLAFHIASTVLLFLVLRKMTGGIWASAFVAAAFALHPLHVESVAWVAERKDVLSSFFWMLTMAAYLRYVESPSPWRHLAMVVAFAFGLMSKPMLVTLPFVLLLLDYWPLERINAGGLANNSNWKILYRLVVEKSGLFVLSAVSCLVTFLAQHGSGSVGEMDLMFLHIRAANAILSYVAYLCKMIWPSRLAALYPHALTQMSVWQPIVALIILATISVCVICMRRRRRYLVVGWLWYLGTLVPVIGLIQVGSQAMADRYTYLPLIGIFIMVAWGMGELFAVRRYGRTLLSIASVAVMVALVICTRMQIRYWQNDIALYEHALKVTENNYLMHNNLGIVLHKMGRLEQANLHFDKSLEIYPRYYQALTNKGKLLLRMGKWKEAVAIFRRAVDVTDDNSTMHNNLGLALHITREFEEAVEEFEKALEINPDYVEALHNKGKTLFDMKRYNEAVTTFEDVLWMTKTWSEPYNNLGLAYYKLGKYELAVHNYNEALRIEPDLAKALYNLGVVYSTQGRAEAAIEQWQKVLESEPGHVGALNGIAWFLATATDEGLRDAQRAVELAEKACRLTNYEHSVILNTLSVAYAAAGRVDEAIRIGERAVEAARALGDLKKAKAIEGRLGRLKVLQKGDIRE